MADSKQTTEEFFEEQTINAFAAYRREKDTTKRKSMVEFLNHKGCWEPVQYPCWQGDRQYRIVNHKTINIDGIAPGWLCSVGAGLGYWFSKEKPTVNGSCWQASMAKHIASDVLRNPPKCEDDWKLNIWKIE